MPSLELNAYATSTSSSLWVLKSVKLVGEPPAVSEITLPEDLAYPTKNTCHQLDRGSSGCYLVVGMGSIVMELVHKKPKT